MPSVKQRAHRALLPLFLCLFALSFTAAAQEDTPIPPEVMRVGRGAIHALAWNPAGDALAVASTAGVWRLDADLNVVERLVAREMHAVAWSPDGAQIAMSSTTQDNCRLLVRDTQSSERAFTHDLCADALAWSPGAAHVAAVNRAERRVTLAAADTLTTLPVPGTSAHWSPDGAQVALSGAGGLFLWNVATQQTDLARVLPGYADVLRWDAAGITLLCHERSEARNISSLCVIDPTSGEETARRTFIYRHPGELSEMTDMRLNPAGDHFSFVLHNQPQGALPNLHIYHAASSASFITPGTLAAWQPDAPALTIATGGALQNIDAETGDLLAESVPFTAPLSSVAWSPDGAWLAASSAGAAPYLHLWDAQADPLAPALTFATGQPAEAVGWLADSSAVTAVGQVNQDGLLTRGVGMWAVAGSVEAGVEVMPADEMPVIGHSRDLARRAASAPGSNIVTLGDLTLTTAAPTVQAISWSPDDTRLAILSTSAEPGLAVIETWDVETGAPLSTAVLEGIKEVHPAVHWSSTGALLHVAARTNSYDAYAVYVYDAASGLPRFQYGTPQFYPPQTAYHPDDTLLAVETLTAIVFVDAQTGTPYPNQIPAGYITGLAWHPAGEWLAGAGADGTIRVWDVAALQPPA